MPCQTTQPRQQHQQPLQSELLSSVHGGYHLTCPPLSPCHTSGIGCLSCGNRSQIDLVNNGQPWPACDASLGVLIAGVGSNCSGLACCVFFAHALFFSDHDVGMQHTCEVEAEPACATEYRAAACPSQQLHLATCASYQPGTHSGMWLCVLWLSLAAVSSLNNTRRLFDAFVCSCMHLCAHHSRSLLSRYYAHSID